MTRHLLPSLLLLAFASTSARAEDVSAAPPQMPTNTGGVGVQVNAPVVPAGGLTVPGAGAIGTLDANAQGMTRLPGQGPTAQNTATANSAAATARAPGAAAANAGVNAYSPNARTARGTSNAASATSEAARTPSQAAARAASPVSGSSGARSQGEIDKSLNQMQKAQAEDAKTGGMSAADEVRRFFHERTGGRELADPNAAESASAPPPGAGGSGVQGRYQQPMEAIAQELEVAQSAEKVPHDAPAQYDAALSQVAKLEKDGSISGDEAAQLTGIIKRAALADAPSAMTKIAMAAERAAAKGQDGVGNDLSRALGSQAKAGSLDAWSAFIAKAGSAVAKLDAVKRELQRVRDASKEGAGVKTSNISFLASGPVIEGRVSDAPVASVPGTFLSSLVSPSGANLPALSRRPRPFEPGHSVFDGYRELRDEGVAFWPAATFVAKTEARALWEAFAGKPAPTLSEEASDDLVAKADEHYASGDAKALAADYASLTGDRDAVAAVAAAETAKAPDALRYWRERLHDLSGRARAPKPAPAEKPSIEASKLASFASYVSSHRGEAAANVELIEADASALAALRPVGTVRASGRDLWVESGVIAKGKARRAVTLAFDAETREPVAGQIAR